jgi:hypothetical protein
MPPEVGTVLTERIADPHRRLVLIVWGGCWLCGVVLYAVDTHREHHSTYIYASV